MTYLNGVTMLGGSENDDEKFRLAAAATRLNFDALKIQETEVSKLNPKALSGIFSNIDLEPASITKDVEEAISKQKPFIITSEDTSKQVKAAFEKIGHRVDLNKNADESIAVANGEKGTVIVSKTLEGKINIEINGPFNGSYILGNTTAVIRDGAIVAIITPEGQKSRLAPEVYKNAGIPEPGSNPEPLVVGDKPAPGEEKKTSKNVSKAKDDKDKIADDIKKEIKNLKPISFSEETGLESYEIKHTIEMPVISSAQKMVPKVTKNEIKAQKVEVTELQKPKNAKLSSATGLESYEVKASFEMPEVIKPAKNNAKPQRIEITELPKAKKANITSTTGLESYDIKSRVEMTPKDKISNLKDELVKAGSAKQKAKLFDELIKLTGEHPSPKDLGKAISNVSKVKPSASKPKTNSKPLGPRGI